MIDLRSDTITLPSAAMREAIAHAHLGDDVYGEDPTVNQLEQRAAQMMGKEAAVLVASGTMGNLSALLAHCTRGQRVITGSESHIYHYEAGGAAALGGLMYDIIPNLPDGTLDQAALECAATPIHDLHHAPPGVVCLENTHNRCGGTVLTPDYLASVHALTQAHGLPLHLDGARIFNAAAALGIDVRDLTRHVDTIQFCLSKGLSAPVGSLVVGPHECITRVRGIRKMLGGGMRQAGIIAAAGLVALNEMVARLADDHANARMLAEGLAILPGIHVDLSRVQTNIVIFNLTGTRMSPGQFCTALHEQGIIIGEMHGCGLRAVTHYGITADDIQTALDTIKHIVSVI